MYRCEDYANFVSIWQLFEICINFTTIRVVYRSENYANCATMWRLCEICTYVKSVQIVFRCEDYEIVYRYEEYTKLCRYEDYKNSYFMGTKWIFCSNVRNMRIVYRNDKYANLVSKWRVFQILYRCDNCGYFVSKR